MKNRIILAVIALSVFATSAFAGDCVKIKGKQYCEVQATEPVALPAIPTPPAIVVVQQPQCLPPSGWVQLPNGALYCQPPIQQVQVQTMNNGPSWGEVAVGALVVGAVVHSFRGHDVVYINHRGGRWGH